MPFTFLSTYMFNKLNIMLSISDKDTHCVVSFIKKRKKNRFLCVKDMVCYNKNIQQAANSRGKGIKRKQKAYNAEGDVVKRTSLRKLYFDDKRYMM